MATVKDFEELDIWIYNIISPLRLRTGSERETIK